MNAKTILALLTLVPIVALAQVEAPTATLACAPTSAVSPASVTLTWSSAGAATCTASGSWTGAKATIGTLTVTNLTASARYVLTCAAAASTTGAVTLTWQPPTQNTDGSTLTNLAGHRIAYGVSATALTKTLDVPGTGTTHRLTGLAPATYFFGLKAYTTSGAESSLSNIVSRAVTNTPGATSKPAECSISVTTQPAAPVLKTVEPYVYDMRIDYTGPRVVRGSVLGRIALGVRCNDKYSTSDRYFGVPRTLVTWNGARTLQYPIAKCGI